jgi:LysM repeat protein
MRYTRLGRGRMGVILVLMVLATLLSPIAAFAAPAQNPEGNTEWAQIYTVQRGDTLADIAWNFGVSEEALMRANSLRNPNVIYVGQQLIIPEEYSHGTGGPECADYYTVHRGDTLSEIALYKGIDEYALAHANGIYDLNDVYVGQTLCIPDSGGNNNSGGYNGGNSYPQQQPQPEPEYPNKGDDGCGPCGQQNDSQPQYGGPQNDSPKNNGQEYDGPQRPDNDEAQNNGPQCNPCDQPHNDGPQCDSCGQPQNDGPKNDGPQRPDEYDHGDYDHGDQDEYDHDEYDHHDGCSPCDGPKRPDGEHHSQLQPTEYWTGNYYNDKYFGEFVLQRQDLEVNFNWFTGSPFSNMSQDRFSVRWDKVENFRAGTYTFHAVADDGVRVYVDDQLIIDHWVIEPATEYSADVNLSEGPHKLVVEYYEEAEDAVIHVYWEPKEHDHYDHDDDHDYHR